MAFKRVWLIHLLKSILSKAQISKLPQACNWEYYANYYRVFCFVWVYFPEQTVYNICKIMYIRYNTYLSTGWCTAGKSRVPLNFDNYTHAHTKAQTCVCACVCVLTLGLDILTRWRQHPKQECAWSAKAGGGGSESSPCPGHTRQPWQPWAHHHVPAKSVW